MIAESDDPREASAARPFSAFCISQSLFPQVADKRRRRRLTL